MRQSAYHPFEKTCGPTIRSGAAIEPGPPPIGRIGIACPAATWSPLATIPNTAPTAHDNEGTPATNPDYDHLLRGTVHDPTTRRMGGVAGHAGVFSTAEDMSPLLPRPCSTSSSTTPAPSPSRKPPSS